MKIALVIFIRIHMFETYFTKNYNEEGNSYW